MRRSAPLAAGALHTLQPLTPPTSPGPPLQALPLEVHRSRQELEQLPVGELKALLKVGGGWVLAMGQSVDGEEVGCKRWACVGCRASGMPVTCSCFCRLVAPLPLPGTAWRSGSLWTAWQSAATAPTPPAPSVARTTSQVGQDSGASLPVLSCLLLC